MARRDFKMDPSLHHELSSSTTWFRVHISHSTPNLSAIRACTSNVW